MTELNFITLRKDARDISGHTFGRLTAIGPVARSPIRWLCICVCGSETFVRTERLNNTKVRSCGCLTTDRVTKHKLHGHPLYSTWKAIRQRTSNPNSPAYPNYGGRGIHLDPAWDDFAQFVKDMDDKPTPEHQIERRDNDKGYSADNCYWATRLQQMRNTRRNRILTLNGVSKCVPEWAEHLGIGVGAIHSRIKYGWSDEKTLTTPVRPHAPYKRR